MDISFFERMRVYSGDGGRVLFKLRLPRLCGEACAFDSFYNSLAAAYAEAANRRAKSAVSETRITVTFALEKADGSAKPGKRRTSSRRPENAKNLIVVNRTCRVECTDEVRIFAARDVYDKNLGVFIK